MHLPFKMLKVPSCSHANVTLTLQYSGSGLRVNASRQCVLRTLGGGGGYADVIMSVINQSK